MDGLMFDTENLTYKIEHEVLAQKGIDFTFERYKNNIGKRSVEVIDNYKEFCGKDFDYDTYRNESMNRFWQYTQEKGVPIKEGLFELLDYLKEKQIKIALATSTTYPSAAEILKRAKALEYFNELICGDMVNKGKPDPEIFITAVKKLSLNPGECIALEDSFNGIISAYKAGLVPVMVPDLIPPTDDIKKMCYRICNNLKEVTELI